MAHKLQGRWRLIVVDDVSKAGRLDGEIYLRMDEASGMVLPGSNHEGKPVTGTATMTAQGLRLDLRREEANVTRVQIGFLITEHDTNGGPSSVLVGRYKDTQRLTPPEIAEIKDVDEARERFVTAGQEEGTWVATKP